VDEAKTEEIVAVGKASADAIMMAASLVKPGVRLMEVAEKAEAYMKGKGYGLAFPLNISVNCVAAHYTPTLGDRAVFSHDDVVKIDFGAEKNGVLGDGALTVDLSGKHAKLLEAAEKALDNALATVKAGTEVRKIGRVVAETVEALGFKPIRNLGGHAIEENDLHSGAFIPNYDNGDTAVLEEGALVAIEPFVTTQSGAGMVKENGINEIYNYLGSLPVRAQSARALLAEIENKYSKNPFAVRWLSNIDSSWFGLYSGISELVRARCIESNPVLAEARDGIVAQAEAELIVERDGCRIITLARPQRA
jgi:methionyl aminopeptidase